jgi:hypothetical protein
MSVVSAAFSSYVPALASKFRTKNALVNVDEIDTCTMSLRQEMLLQGNKRTLELSLEILLEIC